MRKQRYWLWVAASFLSLLAESAAQAAWEQAGAAGFSAGEADYISLAIDGSGTPYIVYRDEANNYKASVMKFSGGSWQQVGLTGFSAGLVEYNSIAIDRSGTPYVAYKDIANGSKASVMKFSGGSWQQVGMAGFSTGGADYISLAIDSSGTPYIAYKDYTNDCKVSVMKFADGSWQQVGMAGFSHSGADYISLAIDNNGIPYVAYNDNANGWKASVMKFSGGSWQQVGTAGFSAGSANYTSLALNSDGTPYIAYSDGAVGGKASVMKFNSATSSWEQIGTTGFSAGFTDYIDLVLDSAGFPYVAYEDWGNSYLPSVMRFNGAGWEQIGVAEELASGGIYISLALDNIGMPYVAYKDGGWDGKASVIKFSNPCGFSRALPDNTWLMTAPACRPVDPAGISTQYGTGMPGGAAAYNTSWVGWSWDAAAQNYPPRMAAADPLALGFGNWLYSTNAGAVRMTGGTATPTTDCSGYGQCFEIEIVIAPAGQSRWNFIGHPFPYAVNWADVKVALSHNGGATWEVYSPSQAESAGYVSKVFHRWNGNAYTPYDDSTPSNIGTLQPQEAVWVRSIGSYAAAPEKLKLLIPAR